MDTIWKPHATVATVVERDGRFLVVEERVGGRLCINQPAGHLEPHESLVDAARRETLEETGYEVEITALLGIYQWRNPDNDKHFLRVAFCGSLKGTQPCAEIDAAIEEVHWMSHASLAADPGRLRSPMVERNVYDYLHGQHYPLDLLTHWR